MADFCRQCSIDVFREDFGDMKGLCEEGMMATVLCEGCGPTWVDHEGTCIGACARGHGVPADESDESDQNPIKS